MYDVKMYDRQKRIIKLDWIGKVTPEEVREVNDKIKGLISPFRGQKFDLIVNMQDIKVLIQDTQKELVKHQAWLLEVGMDRAAVVVDGNLAKMQLKRTANESEHKNEFHFTSEEEAADFLKKQPV